jgi:hypothetical protein
MIMPAREKNVCMRRYEAEKTYLFVYAHIHIFSPEQRKLRVGEERNEVERRQGKFLFDVCGSGVV